MIIFVPKGVVGISEGVFRGGLKIADLASNNEGEQKWWKNGSDYYYTSLQVIYRRDFVVL